MRAPLVNGILLIDKPAGIGSAEVVRRVKARLRPSRVGHLGTLDPFATGLLPIMVGEATKLAPFLEAADKHYQGTIQLGAETDTLDPEGAVVRTGAVPPLEAETLARVAAGFIGAVEQTPPLFSAIKRCGVPLYKLARRQAEVAPPAPRTVQIRELELTAAGPAVLRFTAVCSPGTYLRSLARDVGLALGTAAHLAALRRTRSSGFAIEQAGSLDQVLAALEGAGVVELIGLRAALASMPEVQVGEGVERRLRNGDASALIGLVPAGACLFKVVCEERLVAICRAQSRLTASIARVFAP